MRKKLLSFLLALAASAGAMAKDVTNSSIAIPDAVDLGLPSGTKWATFNIGANAPEEYGDYFAWGEIEPKTAYDWSTYKYSNTTNRFDNKSITKYTIADNNKDGIWYKDGNFVGDNKTKLDDEDDVAVQLLGADWRMPTAEQQEELIKNCYWVWTDTYDGTSVNGYIVYKAKNYKHKGKYVKKDSYGYKVEVDAHIFLPAAGGFRNYNNLKEAGQWGYYWSRSIDNSPYYPNSYYAMDLNLSSDRKLLVWCSWSLRHDGLSVRAVQRTSKITFNSNGGTAVDAQFVALNHTITVPTAPERNGFSFIGWYKDEVIFDFETPINDDITLTAKWQKISADATPEAVDLGLPSGTLWATFNVGANAPEEYGYLFAWGEIEPKTTYDWSTYKYATDPFNCSSLTKYTFADKEKDGKWYQYGRWFVGDNKKNLDAADDVAVQLWGGNWRMPTAEQQEELIKNCYWVWTDTYNGKWINGYIVYKVKQGKHKGKRVNTDTYGYNVKTDAHIFLPAAGGTSIVDYSNIYRLGSLGSYWSRSLSTKYSQSAQYLQFVEDSKSLISYVPRFMGHSVRPVQRK